MFRLVALRNRVDALGVCGSPRGLRKLSLKPGISHSPNEVSTGLWYLKARELYRTEKPYHINLPSNALPVGAQTNEESVLHEGIAIRSLRNQEDRFTLDRNGFQVFGYPKAVGVDTNKLYSSLGDEDYHSADIIREKYYPAVSSFLKGALGAETVIPFTHDVRRREPAFPALPRGTGRAPQPVQGVHVDMTPRWAEQRVRMLFPDDADNVMTKRWQVLNIWRPLFGPLKDWPLALCDYTSIDPQSDLIASDNVYTHLVTETYNVFHRDYHRWYYVPDMTTEEVLVFKSYDSKADGLVARVCPHAAFEDPSTPPGARLRESIECLALVVYSEASTATVDEELP